MTREALWYELDALRRSIDTKLTLLGREGERAARSPEPTWKRDPFRSTRIALNILLAVLWTALVVMVTLASTR